MSEGYGETLIIIPTYNERENVEELVNRILSLGLDLHILIVDDNSPDGTGKIADSLVTMYDGTVHVIHKKSKEGLGRAYIEGFRFALQEDYKFIFEMDADFSHDPIYIPHFLKEMEDCDLVLGSRYVNGITVVNWPLGRLLLSYFGNLYSRKVTGLPIKDSTGGFKCFRREVLENIDLDRVSSEGYSFQIEMSYRAWKKKFRIRELPILFRDRQKGESKMSLKISREAIWKVWELRLLDIFGKT